MAIFIQPCPLARQRTHLSRARGISGRHAVSASPPQSQIGNRKSKIPPCPITPKLHHSNPPLPSGWDYLSTASPIFQPAPRKIKKCESAP